MVAGKNGAPQAKAAAYLRTSSAANVGQDKDSATRQRLAIERYARAAGLEIAAEFSDEAVSGADPVETRPASRPCSPRSALGYLSPMRFEEINAREAA